MNTWTYNDIQYGTSMSHVSTKRNIITRWNKLIDNVYTVIVHSVYDNCFLCKMLSFDRANRIITYHTIFLDISLLIVFHIHSLGFFRELIKTNYITISQWF